MTGMGSLTERPLFQFLGQNRTVSRWRILQVEVDAPWAIERTERLRH